VEYASLRPDTILSNRSWKKAAEARRASIHGRVERPTHLSCFLAILRKPS